MDKSLENIISIFMVLFLVVAFSLITVFFAVQVCTHVMCCILKGEGYSEKLTFLSPPVASINIMFFHTLKFQLLKCLLS